MSVLKSKRKPSQFEVFHHLNKVRKEVTDLLLRDFGYSKRKAAQRLEKKFSGRSYEELTDVEKKANGIPVLRIRILRLQRAMSL